MLWLSHDIATQSPTAAAGCMSSMTAAVAKCRTPVTALGMLSIVHQSPLPYSAMMQGCNSGGGSPYSIVVGINSLRAKRRHRRPTAPAWSWSCCCTSCDQFVLSVPLLLATVRPSRGFGGRKTDDEKALVQID